MKILSANIKISMEFSHLFLSITQKSNNESENSYFRKQWERLWDEIYAKKIIYKRPLYIEDRVRREHECKITHENRTVIMESQQKSLLIENQ